MPPSTPLAELGAAASTFLILVHGVGADCVCIAEWGGLSSVVRASHVLLRCCMLLLWRVTVVA